MLNGTNVRSRISKRPGSIIGMTIRRIKEQHHIQCGHMLKTHEQKKQVNGMLNTPNLLVGQIRKIMNESIFRNSETVVDVSSIRY